MSINIRINFTIMIINRIKIIKIIIEPKKIGINNNNLSKLINNIFYKSFL